MSKEFCYTDTRFADIQLLRYRLKDFDKLSIQQKKLVYFLSEAALWGRDITFDQFGKYNLRIRKMLEVVFVSYHGDRSTEEFLALETYLKRVWFSNGIYHHYGCEKFSPGFTEAFLRKVVDEVGYKEPVDDLMEVMFRPEVLPKRVNKSDGDDLILTSACNFYEGVSQQEVEAFYRKMKEQAGDQAPSFGLNSTLRKRDGVLEEDTWCASGKYGPAIQRIVYWLKKALTVAETPQQEKVIALLIKYYQTGDLRVFDKYSIEWVSSQDEQVDFINGFIEVYGDPLGLKGTWESIVEYKDLEATKRTQLISSNAQWFEDHSPVDSRFRKPVVKGVTAHVICAAMLGGEEYPSTAIGINLPNADWIRAEHGSKSVTIGNLTEAYYAASKNSGMMDEFVVDAETKSLIDRYGYICDDLHTDLHECLGHGSGQLLPGVSPDALKAYGNTIEEARADLFGLYYMADEKLVELGLVPDSEAYKAQYYTYMMNGLMTQLTRINPGHQIEEAHMRNRALIARWCYENGHAMELLKRDGKTYLRVLDYEELRRLIAALLTEVQRIKSEGDLVAARELVEKYGVKVDGALHQEVLKRYEQLHLAPYKGFLNPVLHPVADKNGEMVDVKVDYTESYEHQMLRYSNDYSALI
jgi:dipeptidyl-peptidase-3